MALAYCINVFRYKEYHLRDKIYPPICITPSCIYFKGAAYIYKGARIQGIFRYNDKTFTPRIIIHDGVSIQQGIHLTCAQQIEIGENTAITAYVTITDIIHTYDNIERQDIEVSPVRIGKGCTIYNNAVILPGVTIGDHVVIGANSVVTRNVPDYCVAVGSPARIIKQYDFEQKKWIKV